MAATFSRTLRAVEANGARRWTLQLSIDMILLGRGAPGFYSTGSRSMRWQTAHGWSRKSRPIP
jgi:hypothetical protein